MDMSEHEHYQARIVRLSLDLELEQKNFLKTFAAKNQIPASVIMRAMLYKLETDPMFSNDILDLIFYTPEMDVQELENDEVEDLDQHVSDE